MPGQARGQKLAEAVAVEPDELERRSDLIGRLVVVDDHVKFYVPRNGSEPDELQLKRTPITFQVPRSLRPQGSSRLSAVVVRGVLAREEGRLVCRVSELKSVSGDLDRLERGLASLPPKDFETRKAWALWAERRASVFKDQALSERAKVLEGEALRIESDMKRLGVDAPAEWLAMAQEARQRQVPESESGALGHRAFRSKLVAATGEAELKTLIEQIEAFFPGAAADKESGRSNLARWEKAYTDDPARTYRDRETPPHIRKVLDRRLWADAAVRLLDIQAAHDLPAAIAASERASTLVPERPSLAIDLLEKATRAARQDIGALRLSEVKALATAIRERLRQPDEARNVLADWLKIQRDRLSTTDAEGPVDLANLYDELLDDHVTSVGLLRKAWRIDPNSKVIAEALRSRGFRKIKDEWVESAPAAPVNSSTAAGSNSPPVAIISQGLLGLTADEITVRLAVKPNRVNFVGSKGQLIEQRIYHLDTKRVRFVNLLHSPGELKARVIADYTLPSSSMKGGLGPAR
jgi:tetratricopeptide (TPR) repeat protein